ncbi:GNAT family N-acetyltransferase [bacterium]|nr:GNAT family N-acetyltransferase [bacterium]
MGQCPGIIIRPAAPADIEDMLVLLKELFVIEEDFTFNEPLQRQGLSLLLADSKDRCVLVAERARKVIGMCSLQTVISTAEGGRVGIVEDMVVASSFHGQGVGRRLLAAMEEWAWKHGLCRLQLLADSGNCPALDFYKSQNWTNTRLICLRKRL